MNNIKILLNLDVIKLEWNKNLQNIIQPKALAS